MIDQDTLHSGLDRSLAGWRVVIQTPDGRTGLTVELEGAAGGLGFQHGDAMTDSEQRVLALLLVALGFDVVTEGE